MGDAVWYVANGTLSVDLLGKKVELEAGNALWVASGVPLGPFTYVSGAPQLFEVGSDWNPNFEQAPVFGLHEKQSAARYRLYDFNSANWTVDPHVLGGDCELEHCATEKLFEATGAGDPHLLVDRWIPDQHMPGHQHPCSAVYIPISGQICYTENARGLPLGRCLSPGEVRWVRPGHFYPAEFSREHLTMFVFNWGCGGGFENVSIIEPFTAYLGQFHVTYVPGGVEA